VKERIEALTSISLFKGLGQSHIERIAHIAEEIELKKGQVLFREGEPGDRLFAILDGKIRISRQIPGVGEEALAILGAGDYFGEMAVIDDDTRSGDALAHESCRLLTISKSAMQDLMFTDLSLAHEILWNLVRTLSDRLRKSNDKMTFMAVTGRF
jgi:CRP/FNR family transcriptional regulator, cyclic AMP receptor protein